MLLLLIVASSKLTNSNYCVLFTSLIHPDLYLFQMEYTFMGNHSWEALSANLLLLIISMLCIWRVSIVQTIQGWASLLSKQFPGSVSVVQTLRREFR